MSGLIVPDRANEVLEACRRAGLKLATAKSCTGGLIAAALTDIGGSSDVVEREFVTYSNEAKMEMLGVPAALIATHGAVSQQVALAMAEGAVRHSHADIAIAITGIAGPGGGSAEKPVGLVHIAVQREGRPPLHRECRFGAVGRAEVRYATVLAALDLALEVIG